MPSLYGFRSCRSAVLSIVFNLIVFVLPALASENGAVVRGLVTDPAGAVVTGSKVELLRGSTVVAGSDTDSQGNFEISAPQAGRYHLRTSAAGFAQQESAPFYAGPGKPVRVEVALH